MKVEDPITSPPTIQGRFASVWAIDYPRILRNRGEDPSGIKAAVAGWLVEAPWAHPLWHSYYVTLIHLRPVDGLGDPIIHLPAATHELTVFALDPVAPRDNLVERGAAALLSPVNFAAQLICDSDAAAMADAAAAIQRICDGTLSPDTDFLSQWIDLFGDNMVRR